MRISIIAGVVMLVAVGQAAAIPINLVPNGDFELGNTGFASDYAFAPAVNSTEGEYTVRANPFPWNGAFVSIGDHTSGIGLMYVGNGSPVGGAVVWESSAIAVAGPTQYFFEAFVNNVCCQGGNPYGPGSESILEFALSFDGGPAQSLGTITTDLNLAGTWEGLSTNWTSGTAGSVVLRLVNQNTVQGGNDFAIDDVFFGTESIVNPAPEPAATGLLSLGLFVAAVARRRKSRQPQV